MTTMRERWNMREQVNRKARRRCAAIAACALGLALATAAARGQCEYTATPLPDGPPCGKWLMGPTGLAINDQGDVAGYAHNFPCRDLPFYWADGAKELTLLPLPAAATGGGRAEDLNESGTVVGWYSIASMNIERPCAWQDGRLIELPLPAWANYGMALGVNESNVIVGFVSASLGPIHACKWKDGAFIDAHPSLKWLNSAAFAVNDSGTTVGRVSNGLYVSVRGFVSDSQATQILPAIPGGVSSEAIDINLRGDVLVVGASAPPEDPLFARRAFIWRDGGMLDLGTLSGYRDFRPREIGDSGWVVGYSVSPGLPSMATVWREHALSLVEGPFPLEGLIEGVNAAGELVWSHDVLAPEPPTIGDVNANCVTNIDDLLRVISDWGLARSPADCNGDGIVDVWDLLLVIQDWD